ITSYNYEDLLKTSIKFGAYYGLEDWIDYDLILRLKARATSIQNDDSDELPIAEKLFMGGIGSVRGYNPFSLAPFNIEGDPYSGLAGGKHRASTSIEASIPLSEAAKMRLAFFYDYGMIGQDSFDEITRSSTGVVVEWQSGFGPINLVFAYPIDEQEGDQTAAFEFSMGTRF
ncbi:MAG: BamA/TamA family outer membrane protein, partial [Sulfurovum sp.]|nr:BamA/TamA family outer membrane protein [Sulfurovum sp.]NNJ45479.1 BamA/TamA family outer membrane protein [Sulfurovum sp.]